MEYRYYWNNRKDAQGRNMALIEGFKDGGPLTLMYTGTIPDTRYGYGCDELVEKFNSDEHPPHYKDLQSQLDRCSSLMIALLRSALLVTRKSISVVVL